MTDSQRQFHQKISALLADTFAMADACQRMIEQSMVAFLSRDDKRAKAIIDLDDEVDDYYRDIELKSLELLATQQPMARDLRFIAGILKIITDLERLGDYSVDIVKSIKDLTHPPSPKAQKIIKAMRDTIFEMLAACMTPLDSGNVSGLQGIVDKDDLVDRGYDRICQHVIERLMEHRSKNQGRHEMAVLLTARYLERIADHITNICEQVYYIVSGELVELHND